MCVCCRWGHTPLDDALQFQRQEVQKFLETHMAQHPDTGAAYSTVPADFSQDNDIKAICNEETSGDTWDESSSSGDDERKR